MNGELTIAVMLAIVVGGAIGYLVSRSKSASAIGNLQALLTAAQDRSATLERELVAKSGDHAKATEAVNALTTEVAVLKQKREHLDTLNAQYQQSIAQQQTSNQQLQARAATAEQATAAATSESSALKQQLAQQHTAFEQAQQELRQERDKTASVERARAQLAEELATVRTSQHEREQAFAQQLLQFEQSKALLKQEFENLANQILDTKGKAFAEQNRQSLDALLNPFKQQIHEFKAKVEFVHLEGTKQQTEMRTELKQLQSMHQQLSQEAHDLSTALKGQKKMQGNWGELILENVLERSGLQPGRDYAREVSLSTDEGVNRRPDVIVYLPQSKHLIIDSKVSLAAYTRFVNAEAELERTQALSEHVQAISSRLKELSDKEYYRLNGINSPDMVFMFIPIESAFVEALKADELLFQRAIEKNILIATPTTLLTSLNIVRQLWRFEDQNKHTAELAHKAESVFRKLNSFLTSFGDVRKWLQSAQTAYDKAEGQLVNGKGNLVKQVNDFRLLVPAIRDQLPEHFTEKADLEISPVAELQDPSQEEPPAP